jgi:hypothetical protein
MRGLKSTATSFGINYQFAQRSFKLWLIDGIAFPHLQATRRATKQSR